MHFLCILLLHPLEKLFFFTLSLLAFNFVFIVASHRQHFYHFHKMFMALSVFYYINSQMHLLEYVIASSCFFAHVFDSVFNCLPNTHT